MMRRYILVAAARPPYKGHSSFYTGQIHIDTLNRSILNAHNTRYAKSVITGENSVYSRKAQFSTTKGIASPYPEASSKRKLQTVNTTLSAGSACMDTAAAASHAPTLAECTPIEITSQAPSESKRNIILKDEDEKQSLGRGTIFQEGELVVLTEKNAKKHRTRGKTHSIMVQLLPKKTFRSHAGHILLSNIINMRVGNICKTHNGTELICTRPTLEKYVELYLKRSATPTYPKDAMAIMFMLDLSPGMRVLEAGSGSGALSLYLARCVGEKGTVVSVEKREDHSIAARANYDLWARAHAFPEDIVRWHVGDLSVDPEEDADQMRPSELIKAKYLDRDLITESFDGVALDMAEPGPSLATVARVLKPGRFVVCYLPNITQVLQTLTMVKTQNLNLQVVRTVECQMRNWTFEPNPRMVTKAMRLKEDLPEQIITVARPAHAQDTHTAFLVQFSKTFQD